LEFVDPHDADNEFLFLGMFAIRADRDYVIQEDFMKAVRKVAESKKLDT
jgi:ATP-dependent 26S proteasome regulatory subunit